MPDRFTVHRTTGYPMFIAVLAALTCIETPLVHVAVRAWGHPIAAWVLTAMSISMLAWLARDARALARGGVVVGDNALDMRIGRRWSGRVPLAAIESIERGAAPSKRVDFSILGADVVLHLRAPVVMHGPLGIRREVRAIALSIDDIEAFLARLARVSSAPS